MKNRRLKEIQDEKKKFRDMMEKADTIYDTLLFGAKVDILEKEEHEILEKLEKGEKIL